MSRKTRNPQKAFDDLRDVPAMVVPMTSELSANRKYAAMQILAAMKVAEANHRPTYPKPVELVVTGDILVSRNEHGKEVRTPVREIDRTSCRNHVHLNKGCYDYGFPVEVLRVR